MRSWMFGSISMLTVGLSASARAAVDQTDPAEDRPASAPSQSPAPAPSRPPAERPPAERPNAPGQGTSPKSAAPTPPAAARPGPDAAADAQPAPKALTGPDPLARDDDPLPPLPPATAVYDAPPPPPPPPASPRPEWGAQLRLQGAAMSKNAADDAAMGGIGFSLRPRPSPYFAIDFGIDFFGGRDFNGDRRSETALFVNPTVFVNPRDKVQIYFFAGLGLGNARVDRSNGSRPRYRYVGADAGGGVEFRFWRHFAFSTDVLAFVRDRSDVGRAPEYIDVETGRYTDSSAGALFRIGGTYYW